MLNDKNKKSTNFLILSNCCYRLVEASGAPPMVNTCFTLLRKGAKLVLIGLPKSAIHVEEPLQNVIFKSLTLTTVHGRRIFHTWEQCEKLISEGKVRVIILFFIY